MKKPARPPMIVSDLDGTLLRRDQTVSPVDFDTLLALGERGVLRVIATGRSLYSAEKVIPAEIPVDYLVFSSGAGVVDWRIRLVVKKQDLERSDAFRVVETLKENRLDFMVHDPVPENHRFVYYETGRDNPDFTRRLGIYREFGSPVRYSLPFHGEASQVVVVEPGENDGPFDAGRLHALLERRLAPLKVIRTTSPIDGISTWIEVFAAGVSKAKAAQWIAARERADTGRVFALGNDYNDLDLLEWAPCPFLVSNAPGDLQKRYRTVRSHEENGFTEAIGLWMGG